MKDYDNFFLPVSDLERAKYFYGGILGLPVKFDFSDKGMAAFKIGGQEPAVILKDVKKFPDAKPTIWFLVNDTKQEFEKLKGKGVKFISEPFQIPAGYAAEFDDPFGNRLGITDYSNGNEIENPV